MMIPNIKLQSDDNRKKLDVLMSWCDKFESNAKQALGEAFKDSTSVAGYGECAVSDGWVNPDTREFVMDSKPPGSDWKKFNLFSYDLEIKEDHDAFGKVSKVYVTSDVGFQEVPPYGYLNTCGKDVFRTKSEKPVEYNPEDYVAVQTAPGQIEMIKAKDLSDWRTRQQIKYYGEKAITFTMDAAMVVSGIGELTAAARVAQLGAEEAVAIGGQILKTEAAVQLPKGIAAGMVRRGLIEMALGLTGVFHNAGAHEVPWMQAVSAMRSIYFLLHAGYSVAELLRIPKAAAALGEAISPKFMDTFKGIITSITGTEQTLLAAQMARAGAMESLQALKAVDSVAHGAFYVSEKAFIGMFIWHAVGMVHKYQEPYKPNALKTAREHLQKADLASSDALTRVMNASANAADHTENYMRRFMKTLPELKGREKKEAEEIIERTKQLSNPDAKPEEKQKFLQDLVKYFRYDGATIASIQSEQLYGTEFSEQELNEAAQDANAQFNMSLRKVAAFAMLTLSPKSQGAWPREIAKREVSVPEYKQLVVTDTTFAAKGLAAGLSSSDLMKRLEVAASETDDEEVKATALLCLTLLKKEYLDNTDRDRVREFFVKEPPGLNSTELRKMLEEDAASKPSSKEGWERKIIAAEMLMRLSMSPEPASIDKKHVAFLQKCIEQKEQPEIAVRAMEALTRVAPSGGSALAALEEAFPDENWRRKLVVACLNNMETPSGEVPPGMQLESARARIRFIESASSLLQGTDDRLIKGQFAAKLLSRADMRVEPVEEVRTAAIVTIGTLGIRAKTQVETLKRSVNATTEPSPSVRLAAVDSIERLSAQKMIRCSRN